MMGLPLLLVGCGDDDGGGAAASVDSAFCNALEPVAEIDAQDLPRQEDVDAMVAAVDAAPSAEVEEDLTLVAEYSQAFAFLDPSNPEDEARAQELTANAADPTMIDAAGRLVTAADEECGLEVPMFARLAEQDHTP